MADNLSILLLLALATLSAAIVQEVPSPKPNDWVCTDTPNSWGGWSPVRLNAAGDVECLSLNGKDCEWASYKGDCEDRIAKNNNNVKSVACTQAEYSVKDGWCPVSLLLLQAPEEPQGWICTASPNAYGGYIPVRLDANGDVECLSYNGKDCEWSAAKGNCKNTVAVSHKADVQPVTCTQALYTDKDGWCSPSLLLLKGAAINDWICTKSPNAFGGFTPVRLTEGGDAQCLSYNGKDCEWSASKVSCKNVVDVSQASAVKPVTCTQALYTDKDGWCSPSLLLLKGPASGNAWVCTHSPNAWGGYTPIRLNVDGVLQCLSYNEKNCEWSASKISCQNVVDVSQSNVKPISCTDAMFADKEGWCSPSLYLLTASPPPPEKTGDWICLEDPNAWGGWYPVQFNADGEVQCLSYDKQHCEWANTIDGCRSKAQPSPDKTVQPVVCTQVGYNDKDGWCAPSILALKALNPQPPSGQAFVCTENPNAWGGWYAVRLTATDDVQCLSYNWWNCEWAKTVGDCETMVKVSRDGAIREATCSQSGYNDKDGWCAQSLLALKDLNPQPPSAPAFVCLEEPNAWGGWYAVRLNAAGDVQCLSYSGTGCVWTNTIENCQNALLVIRDAAVKPVTCSPAGYNDKDGWCAPSLLALKEVQGPPTPAPAWECTDAPNAWDGWAPVRLNADGNVECLSYDGVKCEWAFPRVNCLNVKQLVRDAAVKPIVCASYDDPNGWCSTSLALLTAKSKSGRAPQRASWAAAAAHRRTADRTAAFAGARTPVASAAWPLAAAAGVALVAVGVAAAAVLRRRRGSASAAAGHCYCDNDDLPAVPALVLA